MSGLDALVSHIYVVGGRTIGAPPPGAVSALAPKKAARGRQDETLFVLLVPSGSYKAPSYTYENLTKQTIEIYFKTLGGITSSLRETITQLNKIVLEQQQTLAQPLRASLICGVMRENEMYVARCGSMLVAYRRGEQFSTFPNDTSEYGIGLVPPLGATMEPRVELTRYELSPDAMMLMADFGWRDDGTVEPLKKIMTEAESIGKMLDPLRQMVTTPLGHAMVIQFITENAPMPEIPKLYSRPAVPKTSFSVPIHLPTAEPEPAPSDEPPPAPKTGGIKQTAAKALSRTASAVTSLSDRVFPPEAENEAEQHEPLLENMLILLAVLIPLVIVVVVVGLALSQTGQTDYEICRADVFAIYEAAEQLTPQQGTQDETEKIALARQQWELVRDEAVGCERTKPGDSEMLRIASDAQNNLDRFDRVERRILTPIRVFEEGAVLRGPISGNWIQIYTLDTQNNGVYRDILNPEGTLIVEAGTDPIIFTGQSIRGEILDRLVDLEWMNLGGLAGANSVPIVLDSSGLLIWYNDTFSELDSLRLVTPQVWGRPVAMATWGLNLYILDTAANQIWRYVPNAGVYSEAPEEYFAGVERPNLENAVDFGIDEEGRLYILFEDGSIQSYVGGTARGFEYYNLPDGALMRGSSLLVDNNPISRGLMITDPQSQTLYSVSLGGTVAAGYRPLSPLDAFEGISGVLVNADKNSIYVLSSNIMYYTPRLPQ